MGILDMLKGLRTAKEFAESIPAIEADLVNAEAAVTALRSKREETIFGGGEGETERLQREISAAETRIETLQIALGGARRRKAEAESAEKAAALEGRAREALKLGARERLLLKAWHAAAVKLAELTESVESIQKEIAAENHQFAAAGRADLKVPSLRAELATRRASAIQGLSPDQPVYGTPYPADFILDNDLKVSAVLKLPGYWPAPKIDEAKRTAFGPVLQHID